MRAFLALFALILFSATFAFASDNLMPGAIQIQAAAPATAPATIPAQVWTLDASIKHAATVAPELRTAEAEIVARTGNLTQAEAWPNPTVTVRADEKLGIEDGRGGYSMNQVTVTQALPLNRLDP